MAIPIDGIFAMCFGNFLLDNISAKPDIVNYIIDNYTDTSFVPI